MRISELKLEEMPSLVDTSAGWDNKKTSDLEMDNINDPSTKEFTKLRKNLKELGDEFYYHSRSKNIIHLTQDNVIDYKAQIGKEWVELPGLDRIDRDNDARYAIVQRMLQKKPGNTLDTDTVLGGLINLAKHLKAGAIVSDDAQTVGGQKFWFKLIVAAQAKGLKVGFYKTDKASAKYLKPGVDLQAFLSKHSVYSSYKKLLFIQVS